MSDSELKWKPSEWKPQIAKARAPLRNCTQYSAMSSTNSFSSNNSSTRAANFSSEFTSSEESDDDYDSSEYLQESMHLERTSPLATGLHVRQTRSADSSFMQQSSFTRHASVDKSTDQMDNFHHQRHSTSVNWPIILFLGTILCILAVGGFRIIQKNGPLDAADKSLWSLQEIREKFRNQKEELWTEVFFGIHDAASHTGKPSMIILYGNESDTINCLANTLGKLSGSVLGTNDHLTLRPSDFKPDVGEVIEEFKSPITLTKAVVVEDLLKINPEAFKAFHNFCDRENPLVPEAVYIISIITSVPDGMKNDLYAVEDILSQHFGKSIKKDILDPLITRVTDGAVHRVAKETFRSCNFV